MYFSELFLNIMISFSLVAISASAVALIVMVIKDIKSKELW